MSNWVGILHILNSGVSKIFHKPTLVSQRLKYVIAWPLSKYAEPPLGIEYAFSITLYVNT